MPTLARMTRRVLAGALLALALLAPPAAADVAPPRDTAADLARHVIALGTFYALTVLLEWLVLRAAWRERLAWAGTGRGRLLATVTGVNLITYPLFLFAFAELDNRGVPEIAAIAAAEVIPFVLEPLLFLAALSSYRRRGILVTGPSRAQVVGASLLSNAVSLGVGAATVYGISALFD
jgi:hypothetical protein